MPFKFPYENGYSTAGRVVQVGPDAANDFAIGDRVCLGTAHAECMSASAHICLIILKIALTDISRLLGRTFADTASSKDGVWKIPDGVPDELAAWVFVLGVGELALRRAEEAGALQFGATVGIVGLGVVGLSCLAYLLRSIHIMQNTHGYLHTNSTYTYFTYDRCPEQVLQRLWFPLGLRGSRPCSPCGGDAPGS